MSLIAQSRHDFERAVADIFTGYAVLIPGDYVQAIVCLWRFWTGAKSITEVAQRPQAAAGHSGYVGK